MLYPLDWQSEEQLFLCARGVVMGGGIQRQTDTSGHGGVEEKDIRALSLTLSLSLCLDDNISVVTYL